MTMQESAARHMAAGVMDLDELARLVEQDTGKVPSRKTLSSRRSRFRVHGADWIQVHRAQTNEATKRWSVENPEKAREKSRQWKEENPAKAREAVRRWELANPARKLFLSCRGNAKARGLECTITFEMVEPMLAPMVCAATGLSLSLERDGSTRANPWAPSIDRIDCSKGYVPGNVRIVCCAFNLMRNEWSDDVVLALAKAVVARAPDLLSAGHRR